jgi:transposase
MQRYKCKDCGYQFTDSPRRGIDPALKSLAMVLYSFCGVSMGKIGRMFGVSTPAVLKWVKAESLKVMPLNTKSDSGVVMIDEMWHFVNGKKTKYGCGGLWTGRHVALSDGTWVLVLMRVPAN